MYFTHTTVWRSVIESNDPSTVRSGGTDIHRTEHLAGEVGFEPTNIRIKTGCLTAWRLATNSLNFPLLSNTYGPR